MQMLLCKPTYTLRTFSKSSGCLMWLVIWYGGCVIKYYKYWQMNMRQRPDYEANSHSTAEKNFHIYWTWKTVTVFTTVSPWLPPTASWIMPTPLHPSHHVSFIYCSVSTYSLQTNLLNFFVHISVIPCAQHLPHYQSPRINNGWVQITNVLNTQFYGSISICNLSVDSLQREIDNTNKCYSHTAIF